MNEQPRRAPARRLAMVALAALASLVIGCGSDGPACPSVTNPDLLHSINATSAVAILAGHRLGNFDGFYVASPTGGVWATNMSPSPSKDGGLIFPMNDQARAESESGVDVSTDAPILAGFGPSEKAARKALDCAVTPAKSP